MDGYSLKYGNSVGITIVNHPFGNGLYQLEVKLGDGFLALFDQQLAD